MKRKYQKRIGTGDALVNKDELIIIAQEEEGFLLEFEAEMRVAGQAPNPRPTVPIDDAHHSKVLPRLPRPRVDRLQQPGSIKYRLEARVADPLPIARNCGRFRAIGHITRSCTNKLPAANGGKKIGKRSDPLAAHKTDGRSCETCNKSGHTITQCWTAHP